VNQTVTSHFLFYEDKQKVAHTIDAACGVDL